MADFGFEPPSFSLGFDLDVDSEFPPDESVRSPKMLSDSSSAGFGSIEVENINVFDSSIGVSDPHPPRVLKRLRKGSTPTFKPPKQIIQPQDLFRGHIADDEIEDFSSDEDRPRGNPPSVSVCSSSKSSLYGHSVLTSQSGPLLKSNKGKEISNASCSSKVETGNNYLMPRFTTSPLRRFQLIDSDSDLYLDNPSVGEDGSKEVANLSSKYVHSYSNQSAATQTFGTSRAAGNFQTDLWKDFCSEKYNIPTPVFDEVCEEFFKSRKSKNQSDKSIMNSNDENKVDVSYLHPSHKYFFHEDSRIQKLVRDRLPHFFPLGVAKNQEGKQKNTSVIDYMNQFSNEGNSRQPSKQQVETSSIRAKRSVKESIGGVPEGYENWVNPKRCKAIPKDAGKRRVQARSKSAGYWYTSSSGQRVYVSKNGEKLTGNTAYNGYRKESGKGFKKSKKASGKKKTAAKKRAAPKD